MIGQTALYLDGGSPEETQEIHELLKSHNLSGLDGQTTNPSLISKQLAATMKRKVTTEEAFAEYKRIVTTMAETISGPVSIQVIGDPATLTAEAMLSQARERLLWTKTAVIKFPCTKAGLTAAQVFCQEGPVNMTLVFSQSQAAAVYAATRYHTHEVYVSPFVGRLDDKGSNGMDVVANIVEMYKKMGDGHVNVLTASARSIKHVHYALWLKSTIITIPGTLYAEWANDNFSLPAQDFFYDAPGLSEIPYQELTLDTDWQDYDISHELTESGINKFWADWSSNVE